MALLKVSISNDDHIQGNRHAPVRLVEYGDYQCPYCAAAHPVVKKLQKHYGQDLCFVFRHFPLNEIHPFAETAAEAAEFAAEANAFWPMHDLIFENQKHLSLPTFVALSEQLGLPVESLEYAIMTRKYEQKIKKDFLSGLRSGVNGTPTFYINNERYNGELNFEGLISAIDSLTGV